MRHGLFVTALVGLLLAPLAAREMSLVRAKESRRGQVRCANLVYGDNKTSVCFSPEFLAQIGRETNVTADAEFTQVHLESAELYEHPFAIMTGEGAFELTSEQRENLRNYLTAGGFVVASAGCSSKPWTESFRREIAQVFPEIELETIALSHPLFHTVYDIQSLDCKSREQATLQGLEIDGKIVLIFSADGLNDTGNAGGNCCCCGGNEILNARQINVNLLAYTLTH